MSDKSGLSKKLAEVMGELGYVPKRGYNSFHKYNYVMEADLSDAVREKLAARGVFIYPEFHIVSTVPIGEKGDLLTTVNGTFHFVDSETGESKMVQCPGQGTDKGDKGVYKAMTGATKYALMKAFLVPTGDDPELEDEKLKRTEKKEAPKPAPELEGFLQKISGVNTQEALLAWVNDVRAAKGTNPALTAPGPTQQLSEAYNAALVRLRGTK